MRDAPISIAERRPRKPRARRPAQGSFAMVPPRHVALHEITLATLMNHPDAPDGMLESWERRTASGWPELERFVADRPPVADRKPASVEGYSLGVAVDAPYRGAIVLYDAGGGVAGGVLHGNIHVYPAHRGKGLGADLIALAFTSHLKRPGEHVLLSPGGRATRRSAHRKAVEAALADGNDVPPEVLADYPDLAGAAPRA